MSRHNQQPENAVFIADLSGRHLHNPDNPEPDQQPIDSKEEELPDTGGYLGPKGFVPAEDWKLIKEAASVLAARTNNRGNAYPAWIDGFEIGGAWTFGHCLNTPFEEVIRMRSQIAQLEERLKEAEVIKESHGRVIQKLMRESDALLASNKDWEDKYTKVMSEVYRLRAAQDGFDDYCEAHGIPYDVECPECAKIKLTH